MIDLNKVVSDSTDDMIKEFTSAQDRPEIFDETLVDAICRLMIKHSKVLLQNYHQALQAELLGQGIHI